MANGAASSMTKFLLAEEVQPEGTTPPPIQPSGRDRSSSVSIKVTSAITAPPVASRYGLTSPAARFVCESRLGDEEILGCDPWYPIHHDRGYSLRFDDFTNYTCPFFSFSFKNPCLIPLGILIIALLPPPPILVSQG